MNDPILVNDWHPVASAQALAAKNPLRVCLMGEDLVLWRADDRILAWQDLCLHRGTRLSLGKVDATQGTLECAYHGWTYGVDGQCVHIPAHPEQAPPAKAKVKTYRTLECYGLIWASLGDPRHAPPPFPEWPDDSFRKILCGPYPVNASGPRIVENFLDVGHFAFVHEGILGSRERPEIEDYEVVADAEGVTATDVRVFQPDAYGTGAGEVVSYTYKVFRPLTAYLLKESDGPRLSILLMITPHDEVHSTPG